MEKGLKKRKVEVERPDIPWGIALINGDKVGFGEFSQKFDAHASHTLNVEDCRGFRRGDESSDVAVAANKAADSFKKKVKARRTLNPPNPTVVETLGVYSENDNPCHTACGSLMQAVAIPGVPVYVTVVDQLPADKDGEFQRSCQELLVVIVARP